MPENAIKPQTTTYLTPKQPQNQHNPKPKRTVQHKREKPSKHHQVSTHPIHIQTRAVFTLNLKIQGTLEIAPRKRGGWRKRFGIWAQIGGRSLCTGSAGFLLYSCTAYRFYTILRCHTEGILQNFAPSRFTSLASS